MMFWLKIEIWFSVTLSIVVNNQFYLPTE
jgi:hypothetical protein